MSHFTVLVPAKDEDELAAKLLPFHEYECTGIEEYTEFIPADMDELRADFENFGDGRDLDQFAREWSGYHISEDLIYGRITNPNAKWDWWLVGGRWSGLLQLKDFATSLVHDQHGRGKPGVFGRLNNDVERADYSLAGNVDWGAMKQERLDNAMDRWTKVQSALTKAAATETPPDILERAEQRHIETKGRWSVEEVAHDIFVAQILHDEHDMFLLRGFDEYEVPEDEYRAKFQTEALTYAFIDLEGNWNQRGEMGWWGFDDPSQATPDYDAAFWQFAESLPDGQRVYIVDCHI